MITAEILDKLKELQDILAKKNALELKRKEAPIALASLEDLLEKTKHGFIEKDARHREYKEEIAHLERELFEAESARERAEKAMDTVTTQREYEALDNEIENANEKERAVRKEKQKLERYYQDIEEDLKSDEEDIAFQEKELEQRKAQISEEIAGYTAEIEELKRLEKEVSRGIDDKTKFNLDRIIKSKGGVGVVAVSGNVCTGCHMILPAQFANDVRSGMRIQYCPYCSRILYYAEDVDDEEMFFNADDAGSLADLDDFSDYDEMDDEGDDETDGEMMDFEE